MNITYTIFYTVYWTNTGLDRDLLEDDEDPRSTYGVCIPTIGYICKWQESLLFEVDFTFTDNFRINQI